MSMNTRNEKAILLVPMLQRGNETVRGLVGGFLPLITSLVVIGVGFLFALLIRQLTVAAGPVFFIQQRELVSVLVGTLGLALLFFIMTLWYIVQRIRRWRRMGLLRRAVSAELALTASILAVSLPIVLAILLPQQPAQ